MSVYFSFGDIFGIEEKELKEWPCNIRHKNCKGMFNGK